LLKPELTLEFDFGQEDDTDSLWFEEHAGLDESGKGDLFGPIVTACVIVTSGAIKALIAKGVKDSKKIHSGNLILDLDEKIHSQKGVTCKKLTLSMKKYNELYISFESKLNRLLAWMHSRSLLNALSLHPVSRGLLDQFSRAPLVQQYLRDVEGFTLDMQTKAEQDPVVGVASIVQGLSMFGRCVSCRNSLVRNCKRVLDLRPWSRPSNWWRSLAMIGLLNLRRCIFGRLIWRAE
jgi:ribonuclease HIII